MSQTPTNLQWLMKTYFSNPSQRFRRRKGERLLEQGGFNDRLYLVLKGAFVGYIKNPQGEQYELFEATKNMFVGVYSFFSKTFTSSSTVIAEEDGEVAYIDQNQEIKSPEKGQSLFDQFMPVVIMDLAHRQQRENEIILAKERALKKLIHTEKLASLGQMAAGIAHELNNAVAVLDRDSQWLCERLEAHLRSEHPEELKYFQLGVQEGRRLSSREVRKRTKSLRKQFSLSEEHASILAESNISQDKLLEISPDFDKVAEIVQRYWEIGATFHDMAIAAQHATHVVSSVKALASRKTVRESHLDVNQSIHEALALLSSPLRKVDVKLSLSDLPAIEANKGELVQMWTNLIKNAVESMSQAGVSDQQLVIVSESEGKAIIVKIQDNGPGIPKKDLSKIFQPNFTTKEKGLEFGLGLGLTIVERIVDSYNGEVAVKSKSGKTIFTVKLPIRG